MSDQAFRAFMARENADGTLTASIETRTIDELPPGELTVRVHYSSLNYKDALSVTGNRGVTKEYPHQPGIDAVGVVDHSSVDTFQRGDAVIVDGGDLGMNTPGGFGEYIRVPADWAVPLPDGLSPYDAMAIGTAGFTAALAVEEIVSKITPNYGEILVTGATGGVGSYAISILSGLGYQVCAVTGKEDAHQYLKEIGAHRIIDRETATASADRPLLSAEWAGVIDTVGGTILARAIKACKPGGVVTACGNAASADLPLTVFPFILRGVRLIGVDSPSCSNEHRRTLWSRLAGEWHPRHIETIARAVPLDELNREVENILAGRIRGRVVIAVEPE